MKSYLLPLAMLGLALAVPAGAQMRGDLRGPTGQQRVKLPPGVEGTTGGPLHARPRVRCRVVRSRGHHARHCLPSRG